jgi:acetylornithine/N-succinyldiaminopimelate aminotransferase
MISERSFGGKCFFCNSGTEAVEAAMKIARLHYQSQGRHKIITMRNSFHGRTFGSISATGQEKYHKGYLPLVPGFEHVPFNDIDALRSAIDGKTCAVMLEPIQGEGGINIADESYLRNVRRLCNQHNILLIFDEVQTGMARTGEWFGYQNFDIEPDIMTLSKALGGGFPIGAMVARPNVAESLVPGTHASTFGGNPLACAASIASFEVIENENLLETGRETAEYIHSRLQQLAAECSIITDIRQVGMMIGIEMGDSALEVFGHCLKHLVRVNCTHETVLRMLPSLNIPREALDEGLEVLENGVRRADDGEL